MNAFRKYRELHLEKFLKYALVGGLAGLAELALLHYLDTRTALWYVYSSVLASVLGFSISFVIRKVWVFRDPELKDLGRQLSIYAAALVLVIIINTSIVSFCVEHFHWPLLLAQLAASTFTGKIGYIINSRYTFRPPDTVLHRIEHAIARFLGLKTK
jgi:putative flippase GtrA